MQRWLIESSFGDSVIVARVDGYGWYVQQLIDDVHKQGSMSGWDAQTYNAKTKPTVTLVAPLTWLRAYGG